ncbi:MAG: patatin-like phospholipase family protein [Gammaproteobacteria bacterium]
MTFKILSIDGGGIRGIIPGQILVTLEKKLQFKTNNPDARIGQYFDLVAGTSTGAILAAVYVCPGENAELKFSAQDAVDFYLKNGEKIFRWSFFRKLSTLWSVLNEKFSAKALEETLDKTFGDTKLSELSKPTCIISYDIKKRKPIIFSQHYALKKNEDFLVKDLLRSSTAAPTYFEAVQIKSLGKRQKILDLVDGGVVANDPTLCAYSEALKFDNVNGLKDMMILSLGSGRELQPYFYCQVKNWGIFRWAKPSLDIALEGGPQMTEYYMKKIASTVKDSKFYRIQPSLYGADTQMDNASAENIEKLKCAGIKNSEDFNLILDKVVDELIKC